MKNAQMDSADLEQRRKKARRTAWKLALVAMLFFVGFLLTGILGR